MSKMILAVDDSASMRQLVSYTLRSAGYQVSEACDGKDAAGKLSPTIGLVITDLNMPNMNGIEFLKTLRAGSVCRYVPVVVLTTESQDHKKQEARAAGATAWITKPFRPEQLLAVVKKVIG